MEAKTKCPYMCGKLADILSENTIGQWNDRMGKLIQDQIGLYTLSSK